MWKVTGSCIHEGGACPDKTGTITASTVSNIFNKVPLKVMFTYCLLDALCAFRDMNHVVFGTVLLPVKTKKKRRNVQCWNPLERSKNRY